MIQHQNGENPVARDHTRVSHSVHITAVSGSVVHKGLFKRWRVNACLSRKFSSELSVLKKPSFDLNARIHWDSVDGVLPPETNYTLSFPSGRRLMGELALFWVWRSTL
jgi:hypothetical protein